jgi:hypothetical protein
MLISKEFHEPFQKRLLAHVAMRLRADSLATEGVVGRTVACAGLNRLWHYKDRPPFLRAEDRTICLRLSAGHPNRFTECVKRLGDIGLKRNMVELELMSAA